MIYSSQIIGASVTVGHGMPEGTTRWWEQFKSDFVKRFPRTTFHNGAVSAMTSADLSKAVFEKSLNKLLTTGNFFSSCFGSVLPTDLDLYITELDINNDQ